MNKNEELRPEEEEISQEPSSTYSSSAQKNNKDWWQRRCTRYGQTKWGQILYDLPLFQWDITPRSSMLSECYKYSDLNVVVYFNDFIFLLKIFKDGEDWGFHTQTVLWGTWKGRFYASEFQDTSPDKWHAVDLVHSGHFIHQETFPDLCVEFTQPRKMHTQSRKVVETGDMVYYPPTGNEAG